MQFYFDESGDFAHSNDDEHKCCIVCGVVIPENIKSILFNEFKLFVKDLSSKEKKNTEPKGTLLSDENLVRFCKILNEHAELLVIPSVLDLSMSKDIHGIGKHLKGSLIEHAQKCVHKTMQDEVAELARRWGNMSDNEGIKLCTLTHCFLEALRHSIIFHSAEKFYPCWDNLNFIIDQTRTKPESRDELVFKDMLLMWLTAWSKNKPFFTIQEIHTEGHPFEKKYGMSEKGIDLGKIFRGNITFNDSNGSYGLQIADICANILHKSFHDLNNYKNRLPIYRLLMKNCPYSKEISGIGLIRIDKKGSRKPAEKYLLLHQAMYS